MNTKMTRIMLVAMLVTSAWASTLSTALAHECNSDNRTFCNPDGCVEGENHYHVHNRWPQADEYCRTKAERPQDPDDRCEYNGIEFPKIVCKLVGDAKNEIGLP